MNAIAALIIALLIPLLIGGLGSLTMKNNVKTWYTTLQKPSLNPPSVVFGPVWTTLYVAMGLASWLVWKKTGLMSYALAVYATQLLLNGLWSPVFFALKSPQAAFGIIVALLVVIVENVSAFWHVSQAAGILMLPLLAWTGFATYLNSEIVRLNY